MNPTSIKIGILGGGQLGKMLALAAHNWDLDTWVLDQDKSFPAGPVCTHFVEGNFKDFDQVYAFGKQVDVLTIEIEHVNTDALMKLAAEGVKIHPAPEQLNLIKDKGLQKQFYAAEGLPSSAFRLFSDENEVRNALRDGSLSFPFVQKSRTAGYDGRGVALIQNQDQLESRLMPGPCVVEDKVDIDKELAVIVARNESGTVKAFPAVEMIFNPVANLVEFLSCPANISRELEQAAEALAIRTIQAYGLCGLLAVELFLTKKGELLINEVAPRPHNSGHHTIDSCYTSQFEQHLRAILNLPLGSTEMKTASVMVNLLGEEDHFGPVAYQGMEHCLSMKGVNIHLYGKKETRPFRKMGHVTVVADSVSAAFDIARRAKENLKVVSR